MNRPRIIVADDHRMFAEGLRSILESEFELLKIVTDGRALVQAALRLQPDVIVADSSMDWMPSCKFEKVGARRRSSY